MEETTMITQPTTAHTAPGRRTTIPRRRRRRRRMLPGRAVPRRDAVLQASARQLARGQVERALRGYLGLLADDPTDLPMANRTGDLLIRNGQIARGVELLLRVAGGYAEAGFSAKAAAVYRKLLRVAPGDGRARRRLAALYQGQGFAAEARRVAAG
ncbi:MAG: hypothetical protein D6696_09105, partial [Acidobacteria bacterium]